MNALHCWLRASCKHALLSVCVISACAPDPCCDAPVSGDYDLQLEQLSSACLSQPPLAMPTRIDVQELGMIRTQIFDATYSLVEQERCSASLRLEKFNTSSGACIMVAGDQLARDGRELSGEVTIEFATLDKGVGSVPASRTAARTLLCEGTAQLTMRPHPAPPEKKFRGLGELSAL